MGGCVGKSETQVFWILESVRRHGYKTITKLSMMSDENSMDVDDPNTTTLLPSLMPLPPLSLRGSQFRKLMIDVSKINHWSDLITDAGSDKEKLWFVLNFALSVCGSIASTVTKYQKPAEAIVDPRTRQKQASFFFICRFFYLCAIHS